MKKNIVHLEENFGLFLGSFADNQTHKHYAVQLSIPLLHKIKVIASQKEYTCGNSILIQSNISHKMEAEGIHLLLLFSPVSASGHYFKSLTEKNITYFNNPLIHDIKNLTIEFLNNHFSEQIFLTSLQSKLKQFECNCYESTHIEDTRIIRGLDYLHTHQERIIPLEEIAGQCFLSPSRFLHLFKEHTGITYRRAQLWTRIRQSAPFLLDQSITQTAHQFGFTDSAHYSKAFKETFGFSPRKLKG